jgi:hypothetical protein
MRKEYDFKAAKRGAVDPEAAPVSLRALRNLLEERFALAA